MKNYPLWKVFVVFILLSLGIIFAIPSILYKEDTGSWYLDNRLNLGLDLQGGSYLLLEVQTDVLIKEEFENFSDTIRIIAREKRAKINNIEKINESLKVRFESSDKLKDIRQEFLQNYRSVKFNITNNIVSITIDEIFKILPFLCFIIFLEIKLVKIKAPVTLIFIILFQSDNFILYTSFILLIPALLIKISIFFIFFISFSIFFTLS